MYSAAKIEHFPILNVPKDWNGQLGWAGVAACIQQTGLHAEDFIPKKEHRDMCAGCPVLVACLAYGLDQPYTKPGLYGGYTLHERLVLQNRMFPKGASEFAVKEFLQRSN